MSELKIIASTNESTVLSEYIPEKNNSASYQSEQELEKDFIKRLVSQGYEYLQINNEKDLIVNLRKQLEKLNNYTFSDKEWKKYYDLVLANANEGIVEKTRRIQFDHVYTLELDNHELRNFKLIDKNNIHNNSLQVINQYETKDGVHDNRYDVTILVNGLPLVHCELKRRGISIREAFNQINRYQRESFWASSGLYEFVQLFVISNGTFTKYYSNTTRKAHIKESKNNNNISTNVKKTSNSFEFTSYWADGNNKVIPDLVDFTKTFFSKHTILNILTKYCVFTSEEMLLVMRPYQIVATERIINKIIVSSNYHKEGTTEAGGYIWHTTGSGKTLTSFKTAQLATKIDGIEKVIFVVDRKDLDYQTMKEYDRFEKGAANGNTSTAVLTRQLGDPNCRIIITTIQKLDRFIIKNPQHEVYNKHVVLIFDECHRGQFGGMHERIAGTIYDKNGKLTLRYKSFKKYHIFGFTGTPIFSENAGTNGKLTLKTTEQAFGTKLHTYTIVDAINDGNVLPFKIDFINTMKEKEIVDHKVEAIDTEKALQAPQRIENIVNYIFEHFNQKTKRDKGFFDFKKTTNIVEVVTKKDNEEKLNVKIQGFNSIFAVSSIDMARAYYLEFKKQMENDPSKKLKIATIYSYGVNDDVDGIIDENPEDTSLLDASQREFLEATIKDYNEMFKTNYDTSSDKFQNYYKDVSMRMKNRELDLLIVVNMFLTGFDATTLNTLWVDKNLKYHGLIQAYSRTNRILNSIKTYGNIVCFRNLQEETDKAIGLFGDKDAGGIVMLLDFNSYYEGYDDRKGEHHEGYRELVARFKLAYPDIYNIIGETNEKGYIKLFGKILRLLNILTAFDEFVGKEIFTPREFQDYQAKYIDLYEKYIGKQKVEKENINDDIEFEMELVKHIEVNIDYILMLVEKYHASNCQDKAIIDSIMRSIDATVELRSKKALIEQFINQINVDSDITNDWIDFVNKKKEEDLDAIITEYNLKKEETIKLMKNALRDGELKTTGINIDNVLSPMSLFDSQRVIVKNKVIDALLEYFEKYSGIGE